MTRPSESSTRKSSVPWYRNYASLSAQVVDLKQRFETRCQSLGVNPQTALSELSRDLTIKMVHESNWQEGIYLTPGRTRELALYFFDHTDEIPGPHLDIKQITETHRRHVVKLKRQQATVNDLAAFNLSAAHYCIDLIGNELASRQGASIMQCLLQFRDLAKSAKFEISQDPSVQRGFAIMDSLLADQTPAPTEITGGISTQGQYLQHVSKLDFDELLHPMKTEYIHFLHRILLMGVAQPKKSGKFRLTPVHVGHPDIIFPPPSMVPGLMKEFVNNFPTILPTTVKYDPILKAAKASHRFVQIHPYFDGNGRIARLITNLILWKRHPPIYLKADKKGRHRYMQALKRADRGNIEPYASLIALSLLEIYEKLINFVDGRIGATPVNLRFPV